MGDDLWWHKGLRCGHIYVPVLVHNSFENFGLKRRRLKTGIKEATMEFLRFLHENHILKILPFIAFILYLTVVKYRAKGRPTTRHSNRLTSRSSEYYSTERDEL